MKFSGILKIKARFHATTRGLPVAKHAKPLRVRSSSSLGLHGFCHLELTWFECSLLRGQVHRATSRVFEDAFFGDVFFQVDLGTFSLDSSRCRCRSLGLQKLKEPASSGSTTQLIHYTHIIYAHKECANTYTCAHVHTHVYTCVCIYKVYTLDIFT